AAAVVVARREDLVGFGMGRPCREDDLPVSARVDAGPPPWVGIGRHLEVDADRREVLRDGGAHLRATWTVDRQRQPYSLPAETGFAKEPARALGIVNGRRQLDVKRTARRERRAGRGPKAVKEPFEQRGAVQGVSHGEARWAIRERWCRVVERQMTRAMPGRDVDDEAGSAQRIESRQVGPTDQLGRAVEELVGAFAGVGGEAPFD